MKKHLSIILFILPLLILATASCKKGGGVKPVLNVNNLNDATVGGDKVKFDMNGSGVYAITRLNIQEQYNSGSAKTLVDSTLKESKSVFTYVYNYTIPADAKKGDKITLTFTITDSRNNTSTVVKTIEITGSQPRLTVNADHTTAAKGGTVNLNIHVVSSEANLGKVDVQESRNGQQATTIDTKSWQGQSDVSWTYTYTVPSTAQSGENIILFVLASTNDGAQRYSTVTIHVQ